MKKLILLLTLLLLFIQPATAQKIKINAGINNNKLVIKTNVSGHKVTFKSTKLTKNKYLKLINVMI